MESVQTRPSLTGHDDAPVVSYLQQLLEQAVSLRASDLHFEPYEHHYRVRMRIDGELRELAMPHMALKDRLASRIKVLSRLDIAEKRLPQDGRMKLQLAGGRELDLRISTLPTLFGEKLVIRILDSAQAQLDLRKLGYEPEDLNRLIEAIRAPHGMVLVTGPTGSGKTQSLYACLNLLNTPEVNIATVEDPCEIQLEGINQVNVQDKPGLSFAVALRAFLRQDPDILMVGEVRDLETANIAIQAAQTGHLVLSTLHTNDAPGTLVRLRNMGTAPYNIAASVTLITAQRLVRCLCPHCKKSIALCRLAPSRSSLGPLDRRTGRGFYASRMRTMSQRLLRSHRYFPGHAHERRDAKPGAAGCRQSGNRTTSTARRRGQLAPGGLAKSAARHHIAGRSAGSHQDRRMNTGPTRHAHPAFAWKGLNAQGQPVQGRLNAVNADLARAQLRRQGLQHVQLQRLWWDKAPKVRPKDLAAMTRQLAALLRAGVPLLQALNMLCRSMVSPALVQTMQSVQSDVEAGLSLHLALAKHSPHFSGLYVHMVQAGESAGILETMMERLSVTLEKNEAVRSKIRSALMYPCAVLSVAIGILVMILVFVVPVFQDVFQSFGAELPWATQLVVGFSDALVNSGPLLLVVALSGVWLVRRSSQAVSQARQWLARWLLRWPVVGPLMTTSVVARWAQTLSALLSAGVPLTEALGPTAQACDHPVFERITLQLQRRVAQGSSLSEALTQTGRFPAMIVQLCATGEETGSLDSLLARAAGLMETEMDDQVNGLSSLLEPLIIVVLGGFIGCILVAMYLPIFRLGQAF